MTTHEQLYAEWKASDSQDYPSWLEKRLISTLDNAEEKSKIAINCMHTLYSHYGDLPVHDIPLQLVYAFREWKKYEQV
jgi:hypothetical protein